MNAQAQNMILVDAASKGLVFVAQIALHEGADIHFNQDQAIRCAAENGHADMVAMLANRGADLNALKGGALRRAVKKNHPEIVLILLQHGADPDIDDGQPLIDAAMQGRFEVVCHLLDHGADTAVSNNMALGYAAFSGYENIVRRLMEAGADLFSAKSNAIFLAKSNKHEDIAALLLAERESQRNAFLANMSFAADIRSFATEQYLNTRESGLMRAIKMGCLDGFLEKFEAAGGILTAEMLFAAKDTENTVTGNLLVMRGELGKIFRLPLWGNDAAAMAAAYNRFSAAQKDNGKFRQPEFDAVMAAHKRDVLKGKMGDRFRLKP